MSCVQALLLALSAAILLESSGVGCREQSPTDAAQSSKTPSNNNVSPPTDAPPGTPPGPLETLRTMKKLRLAGRYGDLAPFLLPEQHPAVLAQIRAVDRLHATANLLRNRVHQQFGLSAAQEFDYRQAANILGPLSPDVELFREDVTGDRATVTFQVAGRLPIESAELVYRDGRWRLDADPVDGVPAEILKLADLLERMADALTRRVYSVEQLRRELELRTRPILRRLQTLVNQHARPTDDPLKPR